MTLDSCTLEIALLSDSYQIWTGFKVDRDAPCIPLSTSFNCLD